MNDQPHRESTAPEREKREKREENTAERLSRERGEDYFPELQLVVAMGRTMRVGHGVEMRVRLVNRGSQPLRELELEFLSRDAALLRVGESRRVHQLRPGETLDRVSPISLEPQRAGERKLEIRARLGDCGNGQPLALESYIVLRIDSPTSHGERHYHLQIDGPPVNVKRNIGGGMEGNRIVGSDERVIVDNRQELHVHEADESRRNDSHDLIQQEAQFWLDYEGTQELLRQSHATLRALSRYGWVEQPPSATSELPKPERTIPEAWVLEATTDHWRHRYMLLMRGSVSVGRGRENDYILRYAPYGDARSDEASSSISRKLGFFDFQNGKLSWRYLKLEGDALDAQTAPSPQAMPIGNTPRTLEDDSLIELVRGMTLRVRVEKMQDDAKRELSELAREMKKLEPRLTASAALGSAPALKNLPAASEFGIGANHDIAQITVTRQSDPSGETLIWLPRLASIGHSPRNAVRLLADEVEPIHARLIYHQGNLALENQGTAANTFLEDRKLERGELALLQPGNAMRIGKARLVLKAYDPQEFLDRCKRESRGRNA